MHIEAKNLKRYFGNTKAVDDLSFSFKSGDVVGFVGPNGAGKTTTLKILATLDEPTAGDVYIDGVSVKGYPEKIRMLMGFVPDALPDNKDVSVHEYLDFFGRAYGLHGKRLKSALEGVEEFTGLNMIKNKVVSALSKGMKQRVSLGRALIHDPSVLLMDEPASGLDPRARIEFRELILALAAQGKAVLISSHILTELTEMCNCVVIIEKGRLIAGGGIDDVVEQSVKLKTVAIRPLDNIDGLCRDLLETPFVEDLRRVGDEVHVDITGDEEAGADVLAALIRKGRRITEYRQLRADLEDVFMKVTNGEVS